MLRTHATRSRCVWRSVASTCTHTVRPHPCSSTSSSPQGHPCAGEHPPPTVTQAPATAARRCSRLCCMLQSGLRVRPPPWALGTHSRLCSNVLQRPRLPLLPGAGLLPAPLNSGLDLSPTKRGRSDMVPPWSCLLRGPTASALHRLRRACGARVCGCTPGPESSLSPAAICSSVPAALGAGGREGAGLGPAQAQAAP